MKPQIIGIDPQTMLGLANRSRGRDGKTQNLFDSLLAQLSAKRLEQTSAPQSTGSASTASASNSADPLPASQTPLALLEKGLNDNGVSLERLQIPASDRAKLEEVLVSSGYRAEDAKQILDKASNGDGSINLGTVFSLLPNYTPEQGPQFMLKVADKPLLSQVLKGLGVPAEDVNTFMEGLETVGEQVRVTGLPALLAKAEVKTGTKSGQVDRSVLSDLLGKMGLSTQEIESLLAKAYDGEGRANPKAVLALLQTAANRQDQTVANSLKDLAQRIKVAPQGQGKPLDAERLRAQFIKVVEQVESGLTAKHAELGQELAQALSALSKGQGEGRLNELLPRLMKTEGAAQVVQEAQGAPAADTAPAPAASARTQSELGGGFARQGGGESQAQAAARPAPAAGERPQAQTSFAAAINRAGQAGTVEGTAAPRGVLPPHVVRQVGLAMTQMVAREQTTLRLELKPPSLGELNLELAVKDGVVSAKMVAESAAAKQALEAGLDQLKADLASQGLKIERVEITVNPDAERGQAQAQARSGEGGGQGGSGSGGGDRQGEAGSSEDEVIAAEVLAQAAGARISVFA